LRTCRCQRLLRRTIWGMHRMNPECPDSDRSDLSISLTILMREEPGDEDKDEEEHDGGGEDNDGDDGYSE
jgi:hypothetical protein